MPFNLLLFPIVGGYYILVRSIFLSYLHQRIDRQKLIFNSAIAGIAVLVVSLLLKFAWLSIWPESAAFLRKLIPIEYSHAGTTIFSFFLAVGATEITNIIFRRKYNRMCLYYAIDEIGTELELLLKNCAETEDLVQITLKNDKFYIGYVVSIPIPQRSNYIVISPAFSGYREKESKKLQFTEEYLEIYASYVAEAKATDIKTLSHIHIKIDEILVANRFDIDMYEKFQKRHKG